LRSHKLEETRANSIPSASTSSAKESPGPTEMSVTSIASCASTVGTIFTTVTSSNSGISNVTAFRTVGDLRNSHGSKAPTNGISNASRGREIIRILPAGYWQLR